MLTRGMSTLFPIRPMTEDFGRLMESFFADGNGFVGSQSGRAFPPLNIWEDEASLFVEAELPGFAMDELDVNLVDNALTISGQRRVEPPGEEVRVHRRERPDGQFSRTVRFNTDIDAAKVGAKLEHGVLTVTLPKGAAARPRKIEVKAE